jgi:hypothetical protein
LAFKKTADKKFYCEINLVLKEYGELDLMMGLYDENQLESKPTPRNLSLKPLSTNISPICVQCLSNQVSPPDRFEFLRETNPKHLSMRAMPLRKGQI